VEQRNYCSLSSYVIKDVFLLALVMNALTKHIKDEGVGHLKGGE